MSRASYAAGIFAIAMLSACGSANSDGASSQTTQRFSDHDPHWIGKFQMSIARTNTLTVFAIDDDNYAYFSLTGKDFFGKTDMVPVVGRAQFLFIDDAAQYQNGTCKLELDKFFDNKQVEPDVSSVCGGRSWADLVGFYDAIPGNPLAGSFTRKGTPAGWWTKGTPDSNAVLTPSDADPKVVHVLLSAGSQTLEGDAALKLDQAGVHLALAQSETCGVDIVYGADAIAVTQTGYGCGRNGIPAALLGAFAVPPTTN